ncbi:STAS domain-containing protein [Hymenobacter lucidus]|uniref:STAS domain-containing protein n=1 Tax=Hymenobacter lucidus TaxID=2880930 RepID=A0ABS8AR40_9BACT|nr:STAS domain-containing protein [Hymenobacter lucidus]MCB2408687.1 STAS domain-containing protein [Hymenobacter lucidus]
MYNLNTASPDDYTPYLIRVNFNEIKPMELARMLMRYSKLRRPRLLIDCQNIKCVRTRGVAYFVSQLLTLQAAGAKVLLCNPDPILRRILRVLHLENTFQLDESAAVSTGAQRQVPA